jgi:hypothetical protein
VLGNSQESNQFDDIYFRYFSSSLPLSLRRNHAPFRGDAIPFNQEKFSRIKL